MKKSHLHPQPGPSDPLSPEEAARHLGRKFRRRTTAKRVRAWITHGQPIGDTVVRLRSQRVGRRHFTSAIWLDEFFDQCAEANAAHYDARRDAS